MTKAPSTISGDFTAILPGFFFFAFVEIKFVPPLSAPSYATDLYQRCSLKMA